MSHAGRTGQTLNGLWHFGSLLHEPEINPVGVQHATDADMPKDRPRLEKKPQCTYPVGVSAFDR